MGLTDDLERLDELRRAGALSDDEFALAKGRLLAESATTNPPSAPTPAPKPKKSKYEADGQLAPVHVRYSLGTAIFMLVLGLVPIGFAALIFFSAQSENAPSPPLYLALLATSLPFTIPAIIGFSRKPHLILSKDGLSGQATGGELIPWSAIDTYAMRSKYSARLTVTLRDGRTLKVSTLNVQALDFSPALLNVFVLIKHRLITGRFTEPEELKDSWITALVIVGVIVAFIAIVAFINLTK